MDRENHWPTVKPRQLSRLVRLCLKVKRNLLVGGLHGIGKSSILQDAASQAGYDVCVIDLSLLEASDLTGLPYRDGRQTRYAKPVILPTQTARGKRGGLLILEELNRCERLTRQPALQLLTRGTLNDYTLPKGWTVAACINRNGQDDTLVYDVDEMDPALLSRFACVSLVPSIADWLEWARHNGVNEKVRRFVQTNEQVFLKANPRSFAYLSDMLAAAEREEDVLMSAQSVLQDKDVALAFYQQYSGEAGGETGATPPAKEEDLLKRLVMLDVKQLHELLHATVAELTARKEPLIAFKPGDHVEVLYWEVYTAKVVRTRRDTTYVKNDEDGAILDSPISFVKKIVDPA